MDWIILHNTCSVVKRHILFVESCENLSLIHASMLNCIEFIVLLATKRVSTLYQRKYKVRMLYARDEMRDFRDKFKTMTKLSYLGHIFTLAIKPATYNLLDEWLIYDINVVQKLSIEPTKFFIPPHVVVFDMDSTLITEEEQVQIRDPTIYKALEELKSMNCVLILWSHGNREHVVDSLAKLELDSFFDIVLSEGRHVGQYSTRAEVDEKYHVIYKSTPFYLDMDNVRNIPKSPRVVLWYIQKHKIGPFKTITLVDDLYDNNISYDNFVNLKTCPVPVDDWNIWHKQIVRFIQDYDARLK
ncbi:hypothetical protein [Phthorimaea operculella granulovirus]|uniref:38K n=1 Tax=Phthorimaea operculella granulovirus TaxID=192584 RepID=Q8JRX9_9BBAC|nr:hypothetical protein [Phthorimaea operculella granulovirus]AAM70278.1 hypothetical protein [Phthorimaea operculella granulovirus]